MTLKQRKTKKGLRRTKDRLKRACFGGKAFADQPLADLAKFGMFAQYKFLLLVACILPNMQRASTFSPGSFPAVSMPRSRTHASRTCTITCQAVDARVSRRDLGLLVSGLLLANRKPAYAEEQKIPPGDIFTDPQGEVCSTIAKHAEFYNDRQSNENAFLSRFVGLYVFPSPSSSGCTLGWFMPSDTYTILL